MADEGLKIEISEKKFKNMAQEERDWMLFQAISFLNGHGCTYAKNKFKILSIKNIGAAFAGGFAAVAAKMVIWNK